MPIWRSTNGQPTKCVPNVLCYRYTDTIKIVTRAFLPLRNLQLSQLVFLWATIHAITPKRRKEQVCMVVGEDSQSGWTVCSLSEQLWLLCEFMFCRYLCSCCSLICFCLSSSAALLLFVAMLPVLLFLPLGFASYNTVFIYALPNRLQSWLDNNGQVDDVKFSKNPSPRIPTFTRPLIY